MAKLHEKGKQGIEYIRKLKITNQSKLEKLNIYMFFVTWASDVRHVSKCYLKIGAHNIPGLGQVTVATRAHDTQ